MSGKVDSVVRIPCKLEESFFKQWLIFLQPFHRLSEREMEVAACFIKHRYILSKVILDNDLLDKTVMSEDIRKKIKEECNLKQSHYQVIMAKLKKNGLIQDGKINPRYVPKVSSEDNFKLLILFDFT